MSSRRIIPWLVCGLMATLSVLLLACASAPQAPPQESRSTNTASPVVDRAVPSPDSTPSKQRSPEQMAAKQSAKVAPPKPEEIEDAVARVFQKTATADNERPQKSFVVGDFNGDGSEDLAVVVKPSEGGLVEINSELANWTLEDPGNVPLPGASAPRQPVTNKRIQAERGKTLLAIIHGVGPLGWRSSEAKQSYLLKNGAGSGIIVQPITNLRSGKDKRKLPPLRGDAIQETIGGRPGLLFWTGAKYAWYPTQSGLEAEVH